MNRKHQEGKKRKEKKQKVARTEAVKRESRKVVGGNRQCSEESGGAEGPVSYNRKGGNRAASHLLGNGENLRSRNNTKKNTRDSG